MRARRLSVGNMCIYRCTRSRLRVRPASSSTRSTAVDRSLAIAGTIVVRQGTTRYAATVPFWIYPGMHVPSSTIAFADWRTADVPHSTGHSSHCALDLPRYSLVLRTPNVPSGEYPCTLDVPCTTLTMQTLVRRRSSGYAAVKTRFPSDGTIPGCHMPCTTWLNHTPATSMHMNALMSAQQVVSSRDQQLTIMPVSHANCGCTL